MRGSEDMDQGGQPLNAADDPGRLLEAALDWMPVTPGAETARGWTPPEPSEVGAMLAGYQVVRLLGCGGMGAVYEGVQLALQRSVAIKILAPALAADPEFEARFQREAILMARLNHPNIVQIHDFGRSEGGHHYLVMEYVEGRDLHAILGSQSLGWDQARPIMVQVCAALEHAHEQGCLHRDIKPSNIFVTAQWQVKVGDFGLARMLGEHGSPSLALLHLTRTSVALGTPGYVAPEQLRGEGSSGPASDVFSLGVVFYEMLTGELPRGHVRPPSSRVKGLSRKVDTVVLKAMEATPGDRYPTAVALSREVSRLPERSSTPSARRVGIAALVAGVVLVGGALEWKGVTGERVGDAVLPPDAAVVDGGNSPSTFPNHYAKVGLRYIDEWPENEHYRSEGPFRAWSSVPQDPALDLSRLRGVGDVVQVHVHTEGWIVRRASGDTLSSDGKADRSGIRKICMGFDDWFALVAEDGGLSAFNVDGELPDSEIPADLGPMKDAYLSPDHRVALLEDGSIRVWGVDHDGIGGNSPDEWTVTPALPPGRTAVALAGDDQATAVQLDDGSLLVWHKDMGRLDVPEHFQNHGVTSFSVHQTRLHGLPGKGGRAYSWPLGVEDYGNRHMPYQRPAKFLFDINRGVGVVDDRLRPTVDVFFFEQVPEIKEVLDHVKVPDPDLFSLNLSQLAPHVGRLLWMKTESNGPQAGERNATTALASPFPIGNLRSTDPRPTGRLRVAGTTLLKNVQVAVSAPDDRTDYIACSCRTFGWQALRADGQLVVTSEQDGRPPSPMAPVAPEGFIGMRCAVTKEGDLVHWGGAVTEPLGNPSGIDLMDVSPGYAIAFYRDGRFQTWWQRGTDPHAFHQPAAVEPGSVVKVVAGKNGCAWLTRSGEIWIASAHEAKKAALNGGRWIDLDDVADGYVALNENGRLLCFGSRNALTIPDDLPPATAVRGGGRLLAARLATGRWTAWVADPSVEGVEKAAAEVLGEIPRIGDPIDFDLYGERTAARMIWIEPLSPPPEDSDPTPETAADTSAE